MNTQVDLLWLEGQIERWIRFGHSAGERIIDRRRRIVEFSPGSIFSFVRWRAGDYGTIESRIAVLRAVRSGEAFTTYPFVAPGAEVLLNLNGWTRVQAALAVVDAVERLGIAAVSVAPEYWLHVGARLSVGLPPRAYDRARHRAWLLRRKLAR
jgi:hypothetical protein